MTLIKKQIMTAAVLACFTANASVDAERSLEGPSQRSAAWAGQHQIEPANFLELALLAAQRTFRSSSKQTIMRPDFDLMQMGRGARKDMNTVCSQGYMGGVRRTTKVTHYYVPLLRSFDKFTCHDMEGTCRFWKDGVEYIANYGKPSVPLVRAFCKNGVGYGMDENCLHPCRSLAADTTIHRGGEIIFFPELVGKKCGTGKNAMIHDGFMVVNDTGAKKHFNHEGRFDFFWGECRNKRNGICLDGGLPISQTLSGSRYCRVWRPQDPLKNAHIKIAMMNAVRAEAIARGDHLASGTFDLDAFTAPSYRMVGVNLKRLRHNPVFADTATASGRAEPKRSVAAEPSRKTVAFKPVKDKKPTKVSSAPPKKGKKAAKKKRG